MKDMLSHLAASGLAPIVVDENTNIAAEVLKNNLRQFTGTEHYWRYSPLFPNVVLTDGAKYLADQAGAYWLMDVISSHMPKVKDYFAIAWFYKIDSEWCFRLLSDLPIEDDTVEWAHQKIEFSDFPLNEIKLYVAKQDDLWVILLPSEY